MAVLSKLLTLAQLAALAQAQITVTAGTTYQTITGFGFSQAFGRASQFQSTASALQKQALDYLFSTETGAGFSIIRNRIGSGGSGDSIEPTSPGSPSGTPKYTFDNNDSGQVWFSKQAQSYGVKTIYADAWSAPGFMKTSGSDSSAGYLCGTTGHTCSSGDWRQAYANFLVQYVRYYEQAGIPITHLGFLNEPDYSPSYSQMQISDNAQEAISFIPTLYQTVQAAALNTTPAITCCDATGWPKQTTYTSALVSAGMEKYLGVITSHAYSGDANSKISTSLPVWITEAGPSDAFVTTWYSSGAADEGLTWAGKIAEGIVNANLGAYLFWEGFEDNQQQSGSHLVDASGSSAEPSGILWAFTMWSRWVRPGAVRLGTSGSISSVTTAAFKNTDGSYVLVFTNNGGSSQSATVTLSGLSASTASAYLTDNSHTAASTTATLSGSSLAVSLPSRSVVTVKLT